MHLHLQSMSCFPSPQWLEIIRVQTSCSSLSGLSWSESERPGAWAAQGSRLSKANWSVACRPTCPVPRSKKKSTQSHEECAHTCIIFLNEVKQIDCIWNPPTKKGRNPLIASAGRHTSAPCRARLFIETKTHVWQGLRLVGFKNRGLLGLTVQ